MRSDQIMNGETDSNSFNTQPNDSHRNAFIDATNGHPGTSSNSNSRSSTLFPMMNHFHHGSASASPTSSSSNPHLHQQQQQRFVTDEQLRRRAEFGVRQMRRRGLRLRAQQQQRGLINNNGSAQHQTGGHGYSSNINTGPASRVGQQRHTAAAVTLGTVMHDAPLLCTRRFLDFVLPDNPLVCASRDGLCTFFFGDPAPTQVQSCAEDTYTQTEQQRQHDHHHHHHLYPRHVSSSIRTPLERSSSSSTPLHLSEHRHTERRQQQPAEQQQQDDDGPDALMMNLGLVSPNGSMTVVAPAVDESGRRSPHQQQQGEGEEVHDDDGHSSRQDGMISENCYREVEVDNNRREAAVIQQEQQPSSPSPNSRPSSSPTSILLPSPPPPPRPTGGGVTSTSTSTAGVDADESVSNGGINSILHTPATAAHHPDHAEDIIMETSSSSSNTDMISCQTENSSTTTTTTDIVNMMQLKMNDSSSNNRKLCHRSRESGIERKRSAADDHQIVEPPPHDAANDDHTHHTNSSNRRSNDLLNDNDYEGGGQQQQQQQQQSLSTEILLPTSFTAASTSIITELHNSVTSARSANLSEPLPTITVGLPSHPLASSQTSSAIATTAAAAPAAQEVMSPRASDSDTNPSSSDLSSNQSMSPLYGFPYIPPPRSHQHRDGARTRARSSVPRPLNTTATARGTTRNRSRSRRRSQSSSVVLDTPNNSMPHSMYRGSFSSPRGGGSFSFPHHPPPPPTRSSADSPFSPLHGSSVQMAAVDGDITAVAARNIRGGVVVARGLGFTVRRIDDLGVAQGPDILSMHAESVLATDTTPDSKYVATGGADGIVVVWAKQDHPQKSTLPRSIQSSPFSPLSPSSPVPRWYSPLVLRGPTDWVRFLRFMTDDMGRLLLVSGSDDGRICVWDALTATSFYQKIHSDRCIRCLALEDSHVVVAGEKPVAELYRWDSQLNTLVFVREFGGHSATLTAMALKGRFLCTAGEDELVFLQDIETGAVVGRCEGHRSQHYCVSFLTTVTDIVILAAPPESSAVVIATVSSEGIILRWVVRPNIPIVAGPWRNECVPHTQQLSDRNTGNRNNHRLLRAPSGQPLGGPSSSQDNLPSFDSQGSSAYVSSHESSATSSPRMLTSSPRMLPAEGGTANTNTSSSVSVGNGGGGGGVRATMRRLLRSPQAMAAQVMSSFSALPSLPMPVMSLYQTLSGGNSTSSVDTLGGAAAKRRGGDGKVAECFEEKFDAQIGPIVSATKVALSSSRCCCERLDW